MNGRIALRALVFIGLLFWAVYTFNAPTRSSGAQRSAPTLALTNGTAITTPTVIADERYNGLPAGVVRSIKSVVAVQRITNSNSWNNAVVASGVILSDHQILTAGHTTQNNGVTSCAQTRIDTPGLLTPAAASSYSVVSASATHTESTDLAVMAISADKNFRVLPAIVLATKLPLPGDSVYFINYQPKSDGTIRDPLSRTSGVPAVFNGTVIGGDAQGLVIAAGAGTSYGLGERENLLRKGASGGAIVNDKGELVGLSVSSDSLDANRSAQYIGANYGISLPDRLYQVVNGQIIDRTLLGRLQSSMTSCK